MFAFSGVTRLRTSRYHGVDSLHPRKFSNSASLFLTVLIIGILDREPWLQNRVEQCKEEIFCTHKKSTAKSILFDRHFSQVQKQSAPKSRALPMSHSNCLLLGPVDFAPPLASCSLCPLGRAFTVARNVLKNAHYFQPSLLLNRFQHKHLPC